MDCCRFESQQAKKALVYFKSGEFDFQPCLFENLDIVRIRSQYKWVIKKAIFPILYHFIYNHLFALCVCIAVV